MGKIPLNTDENLLLRISEGDQVAFELVFLRYKGRLYDFVNKNLQDKNDAEEIVQEVFLKLWQNRQHLDPSKSLNAFLYTIAKNELFGHLRKMLHKRKYMEEIYYLANNSSDITEKQVEYSELQQTLTALINDLPEKRKKIFLLSREEGFSYREIATELGISENTVDTQIRKALASLKESLRKKLLLILLFLKYSIASPGRFK